MENFSIEELGRIEGGVRQLERDQKRRVWYHLTSRSNLDSIRSRGLVPSGQVSGTHGLGEEGFEDIRGKIFLSRSKKEALEQLRINRAIGLPVPSKESRVLLKVWLPEGYEVNRDDSGYAYIEDTILPENLSIVRVG